MDGESRCLLQRIGNVHVLPNILHIAIPIKKILFFLLSIHKFQFFLKFHFFQSLPETLFKRAGVMTIETTSVDIISPKVKHAPQEDASQGVSEDAPQGVSEDAPQGVSEDAPQGVSEDAPQGVSEDAPQGVSEDDIETLLSILQNLEKSPIRVTNQLSRAYNLHNTT